MNNSETRLTASIEQTGQEKSPREPRPKIQGLNSYKGYDAIVWGRKWRTELVHE